MTATQSTIRFPALARALVPFLLVSATVVHAQTPAQVPLLTKPAAAVAPNVMLTLDDSGSMAFRHMPETVFAGTFATSNPVQSNSVVWDKTDTYQLVNFIGAVPGRIASNNYRLRALRSSDTNTIFYNPEIQYLPWITADGVTRMPNSPVTTAYINPPLQATTATSATAMTISIASKTFTLAQTGKTFAVNDLVVINATAAPTTQWMFGTVTAFNSGTGSMTVNVTRSSGAGAPASWNIVKGNFTDLTVPRPLGSYTAGTFVVGYTYTILTQGNTNFMLIGAPNNNVGTTFRATGPGLGTGTAGDQTGWCYANDANANCAAVASNFLHDPGVYFRLTKTGSVYNAVTTATNFIGYTINAPLATTFTKYPDRLDCAGATCTLTEERQNFANWYTYYRNRSLLARGGLMEAFAEEATPVSAGNFVIGSSYTITSVGNTSFTSIGASANTVDTVFTATGVGAGTGTARAVAMRLGMGRINQGTSASVDGVNSAVIENNAVYGGGGVRDFNRARKNNLFNWLENAQNPNSSTPLVRALEANGAYYSRTDNRGPWTDNPAVTNVVANNKTCRRSYTFLTTDGYWNGPAGTSGNADNTAGTTITSAGSLVPFPPAPYTYTPQAPYMDNWSDSLADAAMRYWKADLQPGTVNAVAPTTNNPSFWQNMTTYTIGLGVRGLLNPNTDLPALTAGTLTWPQPVANTATAVDDLWHAAVNSRGQYFSVSDSKELATAIRTALASATAVSGSTAGVAAASTTLTSSNRKYKLEFDPGTWNGEITAMGPNPLPPNALDTPVWKASTQMAATPFGSRNIVTFDNSPGTWAGIPFNWASIPPTGQAAMGPVAALNPTAFIDFLKGDHSNEGTTGLGLYRTRKDKLGQPFILGDFVNANPALIRSNFDGVYSDAAWGGAAAYTAFKTAKAARTPVLFAGSNDGMLHAFRDSLSVPPLATDGQEIFAYVPRAVYGNLEKLADKNYGLTAALSHQYFVDGPLAEADAYVKAPGAPSASWRNYLMGTLGAGGRAVFALDVTDTANLNASSVRWELSSADDPDIGYVLGNVRIGVLANNRWVAVFGNGFGSTNGRAVLFVVDLEDAASNDPTVRAAAIHKTVLDNTGSNGLGGVALIPDPVTGRTSTIYVGDLKGKLWKLNYNNPNSVPVPGSPWFDADGGTAFFTATDSAGVAQPISSSPAVFKGPASQTTSGYLVVFGTGKLFSTADGSDTSPQTVYSVWDKQAGSTPLPEAVPRPMSRSSLVARTLTPVAGSGAALGTTFYTISGTAVDYASSQRGWYIDLQSTIPGGRVVYPTQVLGFKTVLLSAVAPVQGNPVACVPGEGMGLNLVLPVDTGTNSTSRVFDTNGDGNIDGSDVSVSAYSAKADGVDAVVSSQSPSGTSPLADKGGGGLVGDCTGEVCSKTKCVSSPTKCPGKCLVIIESANGSMETCQDPYPDGKRVWRRIINPPIR